MTRIMNEFADYLRDWCKKNHKPVPPVGVINKHWQLAWEAYMKERLVPQWEDIKQEYLDMPVLTKDALKKQQREFKQNNLNKELPDEEPEESMWDRIKKQLN